MNIYRAVKKRDLESKLVLTRLPTSRAPTNVPYLVDNIWEFLRPADAPSRRQAIYASPKPEIARASASTATREDDEYVLCEVEIDDSECRIAHLSVTDAKCHPDIEKVMRFASAFFPGFFADKSDQQRLAYAPLFMPASGTSEIGQSLARPELAKLYDVVQQCTLWKEATLSIRPDHDGELFFELSGKGVCRLKPVTR